MSRWGWVSNPAPAVTMASLFTSSSPRWVVAGSQWLLKENERFESSHPMRVLNRSAARGTSMCGGTVSAMVRPTRWACHLLLGNGRLVLEAGDAVAGAAQLGEPPVGRRT